MDHSTSPSKYNQAAGTSTLFILNQVRISDLYRWLTGTEARRTGKETWRARATWRNGDGLNISLDDSRGVWHDFVTSTGGGLLDLVVTVRGGTRQEALHWIADLIDLPLESYDESHDALPRATEWRRYLPVAALWRRTIAKLTDELLDTLKQALFDPTLDWPETDEIYQAERLLKRLNYIEDAQLVEEYLWWQDHYPELTAWLLWESRRREEAEKRALMAFLKEYAG